MENDIILGFLKDFRSDIDGKLDTMKIDINEKFKGHSDWITNTEKDSKNSSKELGVRIGNLEQSNAVLKFQMKLIGTISGTAFAGLVSVFVFLLTRGK